MIINIILVLVALISTSVALGNWFVALEILSHVQFWILSPLLFTFGVSLLFKRKYIAGWLLILLIYHSVMVSPLFINSDTQPDEEKIKILLLNFHANNSEYSKVIAAITNEDPDVFVICEANWHLVNRMTELKKRYPYFLETGRWPSSTMLGASGTVLFSKFPLIQSDKRALKKSFIQALDTTIEHQGSNFRVIATHPPSPVTKSQHKRRNIAFKEIGDLIENDANTIIIGDFNNTLHSASMRRFLSEKNLKSVYEGQGMHVTWPAKYYPFGFAIDHIFTSQNWVTKSVRTIKASGSDHRMLVAELSPQTHDSKSL